MHCSAARALMPAVKGSCVIAKLITRTSQTASVPRLLTDTEIASRLKTLEGWKHEGEFIMKTFEFPNFMKGIAFIGKVAAVAEKEEHHPDIHVRYTTITLSVQTHSEGGVTDWDLELAEAIEKELARRKASKR